MPKGERNPITGLTKNELMFITHVLAGVYPNDAYRLAYKSKNMKQSSVRVETSRLLRKDVIKKYIEVGKTMFSPSGISR